LKAYGSNLILKVEPLNDKIGSIIMPDQVVKKTIKTRKGVVESLGEDEFEVGIGDSVLYDRAYETVLDEPFVIIPQSAILYVYE
jgi:hypothetical protein